MTVTAREVIFWGIWATVVELGPERGKLVNKFDNLFRNSHLCSTLLRLLPIYWSSDNNSPICDAHWEASMSPETEPLRSVFSGVPARLREERRRLGLSQDELARTAGVSRATVAGYELGKTSPDLAYLLSIGEAGVDTHFVMNGHRFADASLGMIDWKIITELMEAVNDFAEANSLVITLEKRVRIVRVLYPAAVEANQVDAARLRLGEMCMVAA